MTRSLWGQSPRRSIESACERHGQDAVVDVCLALLEGRDVDPMWLQVLAGPRAPAHPVPPWPTVWAMRGLLWAYDPRCAPAVVTALTDASWRVREMAAKVVARHTVDEALDEVTALVHDAVPRVRAAAGRALRELTSQQS